MTVLGDKIMTVRSLGAGVVPVRSDVLPDAKGADEWALGLPMSRRQKALRVGSRRAFIGEVSRVVGGVPVLPGRSTSNARVGP